MKLTGRWCPQIVDTDSGNLYPIYIYNKNCGVSLWTCSREILGDRVALFLVVLVSPVWWGLHDTLVPLDSTYGSPGPPKMKKINNKFSSDYFHILHVVERIALVWNLFQNVCGALKPIYKMFMSSVDPCILIWGDRGIHLRLRATEQSSYFLVFENLRQWWYYIWYIGNSPNVAVSWIPIYMLEQQHNQNYFFSTRTLPDGPAKVQWNIQTQSCCPWLQNTRNSAIC